MTKKSYNESTQNVGVNVFIKLHSAIPGPGYVRHVGPALCGNIYRRGFDVATGSTHQTVPSIMA